MMKGRREGMRWHGVQIVVNILPLRDMSSQVYLDRCSEKRQ